MHTRWIRTLAPVLLTAMLGVLACDVSSLIGGISGGSSSKPTVVVQSPANGAQFREGEEIAVQSTARDPSGITRVELSVDGAAVRTDTPPVPQGQVSFTLIQKWKAIPGSHTLSVRAFNASGAASDPALVSLTVLSSGGANATPGAVVVVPTTPLITDAGATATALYAPTPVPSVPIATLTPRPPTRVPASPTPNAPPGVYAVSIRVDPPAPKRGQNVNFFVTFFNNTGKPASYRWYIKVYVPDQPNSKGETSKIATDIPVGTAELAGPADWALRGPGPCEDYVARVFWYDNDSKQTTEFVKPDLSGGPGTGFQVCP